MSPVSRRTVLSTGGTLAALAAGGPLLASCGGNSAPGGTSSGGAAGSDAPVAAPTFRAPEGPEPDIAGDADIPDTFFSYPAEPTVSVPEAPGDGQPLRILTQTFSPVTAQPPQNTAWANLNDKLGSALEIQQVPSGEYATVFATSLAGGQLPDMFFLAEQPDMPDMVEATCLDLSDHLAGDAILAYPNLAAIPSDCWEAGRYNGRLYGLPSPRGAMSSGVLYRRDDLLAAQGVAPEWDDFEGFFSLAQQLNDPRGGRWATTIVPGQYIKNMLGIPNFWQYDGTTMQSWWTAPQMEEALEAQRRWAEAGLMNPDAFASPNTKVWFSTGAAYFNPDSFSAWSQYFADPPEGFDIDVCQIPAFDGDGTGHLWMSFPSYGRAGINRNAADRVETLLKVANYFAAPFGTQEYLDVKMGQEGADYTFEGTDPIATSTGAANSALGVRYIADCRIANYLPGHEDSARKLDASIRELVPDAFRNDAVYLYSETVESDFASSAQMFNALEADIVQGRKQVSEWRPAADQWWADSGQQMAEELTEAYHAAGRG
ncbi:extracellular solute-binding protein [Propioniciclava soli]|uniref:extracellular solute-binding protein n=1 Tax=Propioniciclava soli TaxID=2775081 RepID=UPI001E3AD568|nr:extracellular solute-binding protein [Propioniciclava soli]